MRDTKLGKFFWALPAVFFLHDLEEVFTAESVFPVIIKKLPHFLEPWVNQMTALRMAVAVIFLLVVSYLVVAMASRTGWRGGWFHVVRVGLAARFVNGCAHIGQAALIGMYVPGLVTSLILLIPAGGIVFRRMVRTGVIQPKGLAADILLGLVLMPAAALAVLTAAGLWLGG